MATTIGALELVGTTEHIGIVSRFSGDTQASNSAAFQYRRTGTSTWRTGVVMEVDRRSTVVENDGPSSSNPFVNTWKAVIFGLTPNTQYDVRVTYTDPNGLTGTNPQTGSVWTRDDNPPSTGRQIYCQRNANPGGSGSQSSPYQSLQDAINAGLQPGDTVILMPGTWTAAYEINASGQPNNYITIKSYDPANPAEITYQGLSDADTILRVNGDYVRISNLVLSHGRRGLINFQNSKYGIVEDCLLEEPGGSYWFGAIGGIDAKGILAQRNRIVKNTVIAESGGDEFAFNYIQTQNLALTEFGEHEIKDNVLEAVPYSFRDCVGGGSDLPSGTGNAFFRSGLCNDSHIYRNHFEGWYDDCIEVEGGSVNCSIWGNECKGSGTTNRGSLIGLAWAPCLLGPLYVIRNIVAGYYGISIKMGETSYGRVLIYHNNFWTGVGQNSEGPGGPDDWGSTHGSGNLVMRNNIVAFGTYGKYVMGAYGSGWNLDYDCLYTPSQWYAWYGGNQYNSLSAFRSASGQEQHGMASNPLFSNPSGFDFRLAAGSPARDAGVVIQGINDSNAPSEWRASGAAPDLGAIEADAPTVAPTADFSYSPAQGNPPLTVNLVNTSTGEIDSYLWEFGDGETSTQFAPSHIYQQVGTYTIKLTVTGPGGTDSLEIVDAVSVVTVTRTLNIAVSGNGTTSPAPGAYTYQQGTTVNISATPDLGWVFSGWQGPVANPSAAETTVVMNSDVSVLAIFTAIPTYTLIIQTTPGGTTSPAPRDYEFIGGGEMDVTAIPYAGYQFSGWIFGTQTYSEQTIHVAVNQNITLTALFAPIVVPPDKFTVTVTAMAGGDTNPIPGVYEVDEGEEFQVEAIANEGWAFDHWEGDIYSGLNPLPLQVNSNVSVVAVFTEQLPPSGGSNVAAYMTAAAVAIPVIVSAVKKGG